MFLSFVAVVLTLSNAQEWGYDDSDETLGPDQWCKDWPICCEGLAQSPIDIVTKDAKDSDDVKPLTAQSSIFQAPTVVNNGHTLVVFSNANNNHIQGARLEGSYTLEQIHFHWDDKDGFGSEHAFNGEHYDLEMHMIYFNDKYEDVDSALGFEDGLAAVGVLFEIGDSNPGMNQLLDNLDDLTPQRDAEQDLGVLFDASEIVKLNSNEGFYTYRGSTTTPSCDESVDWILLSSIKTISQQELTSLQNITLQYQKAGEQHNWRGLQSLNDRVVYRLRGSDEPDTESEPIGIAVILTWVLVLLVISILVGNYQFREWKKTKSGGVSRTSAV